MGGFRWSGFLPGVPDALGIGRVPVRLKRNVSYLRPFSRRACIRTQAGVLPSSIAPSQSGKEDRVRHRWSEANLGALSALVSSVRAFALVAEHLPSPRPPLAGGGVCRRGDSKDEQRDDVLPLAQQPV